MLLGKTSFCYSGASRMITTWHRELNITNSSTYSNNDDLQYLFRMLYFLQDRRVCNEPNLLPNRNHYEDSSSCSYCYAIPSTHPCHLPVQLDRRYYIQDTLRADVPSPFSYVCPRPSNPFWCPISNVDYLRLIV